MFDDFNITWQRGPEMVWNKWRIKQGIIGNTVRAVRYSVREQTNDMLGRKLWWPIKHFFHI